MVTQLLTITEADKNIPVWRGFIGFCEVLKKLGLVLFVILLTAPAHANNPVFIFNLPQQQAVDALPSFGSYADVTVAYQYNEVKPHHTNALHGEYTVFEALKILLAHTGLTAKIKKGGRLILIKKIKMELTSMSPNLTKSKIFPAVAAAIAINPVAVSAQENTDDNPDSYEVITITSQKRSQDVMTTPVTGDFLSAENLKKKKVVDLNSLQFATPSLSITAAGITSNVNIRGVGLNVTSPDVVPGVAIYRDGLLQPPLMPSEPLFDMAGVEVLRGPQGTFTGSSSTGGAIFFRSNKPELDDTYGSASLLVGSYDRVAFQGTVNAPISETIAARIAINYDNQDSYFDISGDAQNEYPGSPFRKPGNKNQRNIRLGLLWQPSDKLSVLSTTALNQSDTDGFALIPSLLNPAYDELDYELKYNYGNTLYKVDGLRQALEINYEFDSGVSLRSISGYNKVSFHQLSDADYSSLADNIFSNKGDETLYTQEFNLISPDDTPFHLGCWCLLFS